MYKHSYEALFIDVYKRGILKHDRTGVGTFSLTGGQIRYNLADGFPLITSKKTFFRGVIEELLWFIRGSTNANELAERGVHIWDEWADPVTGELGPIYGRQWRSWEGPDGTTYDQLQAAIDALKTNPTSRRIIVNAWNVPKLAEMALPPCHVMFQFIVQLDDRLDCVVTQRSADMFLGVPFDIASFAALMTMVAQQAQLVPGELVWNGGDCHIYQNHAQQAFQLRRRIQDPQGLPALPRLELTPRDSIDDYQFTDFNLIGYQPLPMISAPVAV